MIRNNDFKVDRKIYVADLCMSKSQHAPFNSAFLSMLLQKYKGNIFFWSETRNLDEVKRFIKHTEGKLFYKKRLFFTAGKRFKIILKELIEIINFLKIYYDALNKKVDALILVSVMPFTHLFIKMFRRINNSIPMMVVLHGELEYMREKKKKNLIFYGKILKKALQIRQDNKLKYIILGENIKNSLLKESVVGFFSESDLIAIDHPYIYENVKKNDMTETNCIGIGAVGEALVSKNTQSIFKLAELCKEDKKIKFHIIGRMTPEVIQFDNHLVKYTRQADMLSKDEYENEINKLAYTVFFYDNSHYRLCASGAFFDSVKFNKPIISIQNDFFKYYFDKYGDIGYLCSNIEEMADVIKKISNNMDMEKYIMQCKNVVEMKKRLSISNISEKFFSIKYVKESIMD